MFRSIHVVLRALVGIVAIIAFMRFLGVTWSDVDYFVNHGIKNAFKVISSFKDTFNLNP